MYLVEKYKNNNRISIISGNNFQEIQPMKIENDYYFSIFPSTWGWATWKRVWENYDISIKEWESINKSTFLSFLFKEKKYRKFWEKTFNQFAISNYCDTWDFQFYFHCMKRRQLAVIPKANLVSNIGHGTLATHTTCKNGYLDNMPRYELSFPIKHPLAIERNYEADFFVQKVLFGEIEMISLWKKIKRWIKKNIITIKKC